jgi:hypothetical protein
MKQIIAIIRDGSRLVYKTVPDDFDVNSWARRRKHNFHLLGITDIQVEPDPTDTEPHQCQGLARRDTNRRSM